MGSLRPETMAVRRHVVNPSPSYQTAARRRDTGETLSSTTVNSGVRPVYLVSGVNGGTLRQKSSSSGRGLQSASPSAAVTTSSGHGLRRHRGVNGWTLGQQPQPDVLAFASDSEATSPVPERHRKQQTINDDVRWRRRMYISANDSRHNSPGHWSSQSSTSGRESTSGSILKKGSDCNSRLETNSSCSSSTIVSPATDKYKYTVARSSGDQFQKSRSPSQRLCSDGSTSSSPHSRRVGFKNNVAVYRFDSDGEDSAGYSSTVSETSKQLDEHPRSYSHRQRHCQRRQSHSQPPGTPPHDRSVDLSPASHDAAASWAAARGWSTAADRVGSPRYVSDGNHDRHYLVADNTLTPLRLRSNSVGSGRPQFTTIGRTMYVADCDDDGEQIQNGSVGGRASKYDHPVRRHIIQSQRQLPSDEGCVLSCGSVVVNQPLFVDRAHYQYTQAEKGCTKRLVLTCSLQNTSHLNPDCLVVKANRSGTRARVVFDTKTNSRSDDDQSDQLLLPYTVDPYSLTAQLQADNSLVIEAPIMH